MGVGRHQDEGNVAILHRTTLSPRTFEWTHWSGCCAHMSHRSQMSPRLTLTSAPQQPLTDTDTLAGPASRPQVSSWQSRLAAGELSSQLPHRWAETLAQSGARPRLWPDDKKPPFPILGSEKADFAKGSKWLKTKRAQAREWSKLRRPEVSPCKKGEF